MVEPEDEKNWVRRSRHGDQIAFENLIRSHQAMIHSLTFRPTGSVSDAQDLAKNVTARTVRQNRRGGIGERVIRQLFL